MGTGKNFLSPFPAFLNDCRVLCALKFKWKPGYEAHQRIMARRNQLGFVSPKSLWKRGWSWEAKDQIVLQLCCQCVLYGRDGIPWQSCRWDNEEGIL